ncbi:MAG TPA: hypothetical protein VLT58_17905, partial [Polyangia bacterium]|nr:hypothetical protein [Polyangia bacterium]
MRNRDADSGDPKEQSGAHRLAALLRAGTMEAVDEQRDEVGWRALLFRAHRSDQHGARKPRGARRWIPLAAAVVLAIAGGTIFRASRPGPLTFKVDGRAAADAQLSSGPDETKRLDFSDGSTLALPPAARLRLTEMTARGAALTLERGQLDVSVRHRPA